MLIRQVTKIGRVLQQMEEVVLSLSILTIAVLTITNIGCRTLLGFSLAFTEEVSQFCVIVVCFVGLSYAASKGRHIRMTAIYDQLPLAGRKALMIVITVSTAAIMFTLAWYAIRYVITVYQLGGVFPALRIPFFVVYAVAPLGLILAGVQYALAAARNLTSRDVYLSFDKRDEFEQPVTQEI